MSNGILIRPRQKVLSARGRRPRSCCERLLLWHQVEAFRQAVDGSSVPNGINNRVQGRKVEGILTCDGGKRDKTRVFSFDSGQSRHVSNDSTCNFFSRRLAQTGAEFLHRLHFAIQMIFIFRRLASTPRFS